MEYSPNVRIGEIGLKIAADVQPAYDELLERAAQVFGSWEVGEEWMHSPVQALCN